MKYIIIFLCLILPLTNFSQDYTTKYNSIKNRTEMFNSHGDLVGYKIWNNIKGQYETYTVAAQNRQESSYISPIDIDLVQKVMSAKQSSYNNNYNAVLNQLDNLRSNLFYYFSGDIRKRKVALEIWDGTIQTAFNSSYDYSKTNEVRSLISGLNSLYYNCIEVVESKFQEEEIELEKEVVYPVLKLNNSSAQIYRSSQMEIYEIRGGSYEKTVEKPLMVKLTLFSNSALLENENGNSININWTFMGWDENSKRYIFFDTDTKSKYTLDKMLQNFNWYKDKLDNSEDYQNIIIYKNLKNISSFIDGR